MVSLFRRSLWEVMGLLDEQGCGPGRGLDGVHLELLLVRGKQC